MTRIFKATTSALDRAQARFRRSRLKVSRRGSVLIIVVGLLVLMAIIGTAYISTARTDRGAAATNAENTEVALLLQGVEDMATAQIVADANPYVTTQTVNGTAVTIDATRFRPGNTATTPPYYPYNNSLIDTWLASRVPTALDPTQAYNISTNFPVWKFLSQAPVNQFESPTQGVYATGGIRTNFEPTSTLVNGVVSPALEYYNGSNWVGPYLAADTDGDGIADAGLFRLPCGEINGVTYYGAYRIVDNAAAINASVAWAPQGVTGPTAASSPAAPSGSGQQTLPGNFYPTNVNLAGIINPNDSISTFNSWRFGTFAQEASDPETILTQYQSAWQEQGRRLQNPYSGYSALSQADSAAMAHRFVIRDPNASLSTIEQYLANSTTNATYAWTSPYTASDISDWFADNFNYVLGSGTFNQSNLSLRSILVGYNPVSCFAPDKYGPFVAPATNNTTGAPLPGAAWTTNFATSYPNTTYSSYNFGDWVTANGHSYVCIQPNTPSAANAPSTTPLNANNPYGYYTDTAYWVYEPWNNSPTKTSINTATFGQLWLAYWNVMCDSQNAAPAPQVNSTSTVGTNMFRSSIRYSSGTPSATVGSSLSATQELQLRAALAAVNTVTLRTTGYGGYPASFGTSAESGSIPIFNYASGTPAPQYTVSIMGNLPQPFITEVYADNDPAVGDGANGYIAIEVYNPYPYPIQLTGWALATVSRPGTPGATLTPTVIPSTSTGWDTTGPIIPAQGYAVFANTATPANYTSTPTATVANDGNPSAAAPPLYVVSDLYKAFGNDLVLMRPPPGAAAASGTPTNITGFFPVDSYDFTGLTPQTTYGGAAVTFEWHYTRPQTQPWQFVYPGRFNPSAASPSPRFTDTTAVAVAVSGTTTVPLTSLGKQDTTASYTGFTIQLNNVDFGGPEKLSKTPSANITFPFGQFPRNGDIMQVPYIGSYVIYSGTNIIEMNPVTLDSAYAAYTTSDQTVAPVSGQNIGHFAPYYQDPNSYVSASAAVPYNWTTRLLDYLTVQAPGDDYLPNTDPMQYNQLFGGSNWPVGIANVKSSIINADPADSVTEDTVPLHGLVNINTAPWPVLAALPFSDDPTTNAEIAQAIVNNRDGYGLAAGQGAFKTIFDLNRVNSPANYSTANSNPGPTAVPFINTCGSYLLANPYAPASSIPGNNDGDLSPLYLPTTPTTPANMPATWYQSDWVAHNDFERQNLALTRVSNLITTRSDSYTVYVLVQGWTNAGTASAKLVVQRRAAFIVDRSGMTPSNPTVSVTNVSTN